MKQMLVFSGCDWLISKSMLKDKFVADSYVGSLCVKGGKKKAKRRVGERAISFTHGFIQMQIKLIFI